MEQWIIINYFPHEPSQVYGVFASEEEALIYAEVQGMSVGENAYEIKCIRNVDEE